MTETAEKEKENIFYSLVKPKAQIWKKPSC